MVWRSCSTTATASDSDRPCPPSRRGVYSAGSSLSLEGRTWAEPCPSSSLLELVLHTRLEDLVFLTVHWIPLSSTAPSGLDAQSDLRRLAAQSSHQIHKSTSNLDLAARLRFTELVLIKYRYRIALEGPLHPISAISRNAAR